MGCVAEVEINVLNPFDIPPALLLPHSLYSVPTTSLFTWAAVVVIVPLYYMTILIIIFSERLILAGWLKGGECGWMDEMATI